MPRTRIRYEMSNLKHKGSTFGISVLFRNVMECDGTFVTLRNIFRVHILTTHPHTIPIQPHPLWPMDRLLIIIQFNHPIQPQQPQPQHQPQPQPQPHPNLVLKALPVLWVNLESLQSTHTFPSSSALSLLHS